MFWPKFEEENHPFQVCSKVRGDWIDFPFIPFLSENAASEVLTSQSCSVFAARIWNSLVL